MNLFQSVLDDLSKHGRTTITEVAARISKKPLSVSGEITRLKKTSFIGRWIFYKSDTGEVALAAALRGTPLTALEFMVKQFYNYDRVHKSGLFQPKEPGIVEAFEEELQRQLDETQKTFSFEEIDLNDFGCKAEVKEEQKDGKENTTL